MNNLLKKEILKDIKCLQITHLGRKNVFFFFVVGILIF
jgi:hypothetical protein